MILTEMCPPHLLLLLTAALTAFADSRIPNDMRGVEDCLRASSPSWCLMEQARFTVNSALSEEKFELAPGITLDKDSRLNSTDLWEDLTSRTLSIDLSSRTHEEARGKKKKRFRFLILAFAAMAAVLIPLKLKAIALLATKALIIGKIALLIASLVGLKKLVTKPVEETTHVHYSGHRSDLDSHYLAYGEPPAEPQAP